MNQLVPPLYWLFLTVWVLLGVGSAWFFLGSRDARLKRVIFPWFITLVGALFCGFVLLLTEAWVVLVVAPATALIGFLNIRLTKFCDHCGRTLHNPSLFTPMRFCPSCG